MKAAIISIMTLTILLTACTTNYTHFSYNFRECIEDDQDSTEAVGSTIQLKRAVGLKSIRFEKQEETLRLYFKDQSPCKYYDISISNLTKGHYKLEVYDIKYEEVDFFELKESKSITIE